MKCLAIGPAGMGYYAMLGAVSNINFEYDEIAGSSAGAIIGMCLACGKTVDEIKEWSLGLNLKELSKMNLKAFLTNYGLIAHAPIKKVLTDFVGNPKFKDLTKKLHVSSFCVNTTSTDYFSVDTHPNMHVVDAVCMSMSVPFLFESVKHNDMLYVDGGTVEQLPLKAFEHRKDEDIVSIKIENNFTQKNTKIKDFKQFVLNLIIATLKKPQVIRGKVIRVPLGSVNIFDFSMTQAQRLELFSIGTLKCVE